MRQTTFVAVYRGRSIADSRLIAVSADPRVVAAVSGRLLEEPSREAGDPVVASIQRGRRAALRAIRREVADAAHD